MMPLKSRESKNMKTASMLPRAGFGKDATTNCAKLEANKKNWTTNRRTRPWRCGDWLPP
jgi:hypothetical protein